MKVTEHTVKKLLMAALLALLFVPLIQMKFNVIKVKELAGYFTKKEKVYLKKDAWLSGEYQEATSEFVNDNFGFRPLFVRTRNQVHWELCRQARAQNVVIGHDNYLFDWNYIHAWNGRDYCGDAHYKDVSNSLKTLQDSLQKRNVLLVVALAPGKASFFSEYIPEGPWKKEGEKSSYKSLAASLSHSGVNTVDFYKWFMQMKGKESFPLYSKGGIHWSNYGCWLAMDSLIKYFEKKTGADFVSMKMKDIKLQDSVMPPDNDVGEAMNLLVPPTPTKMAYPQVEWESKEGRFFPGLYVVGDSYFWQMYSNGFSQNAFDRVAFSYYNREVYDSKKEKFWMWEPPHKFPFDPQKYKVLLLISTEANFKNFPWGFTRMAEKTIYNKK